MKRIMIINKIYIICMIVVLCFALYFDLHISYGLISMLAMIIFQLLLVIPIKKYLYFNYPDIHNELFRYWPLNGFDFAEFMFGSRYNEVEDIKSIKKQLKHNVIISLLSFLSILFVIMLQVYVP